MSRGTLAVLVFCVLGTAAVAADQVPKDVQAYIDRRTGCNYWPSEPAYDKTRKAEIRRHVRELRCETIDREEAKLNARYQGRPALLEALANAHDAMPD